MDDQYISVSEFAKRAGVSRQAVYSRLDSQELVKFVQVNADGKKPKKLISTDALVLFEKNAVNQVVSQDVSSLDKTFDTLKMQLDSKDKTIESLLKQIDQLQAQNASLSESLITQGQELTRLLDQQQRLSAAQYKQISDGTQQTTDDDTKKGWFRRFFKR